MGLLSAGVGDVRRTKRSHAGLAAGIDRLRSLARDPGALDASAPAISDWSVGLHVEHLWKAESGILGWIGTALADPDDHPSGGGPSKTGTIVLISGWIPRGRAQAPERSLPDAVGEDLLERLNALRDQLDRLEPAIPGMHASVATLEHPLLGHLTPAQWLRFLDVHHRHHEKIIRDIRG